MRVIRSYHDLRRKHEPDYDQDSEQALLHGHRRGVFVAPLACNAREYLTGETDSICYYDWPIADLIAWWKERWLKVRINNPDIMQRVRAFSPETYRVSDIIPTSNQHEAMVG
jgi:hypothetical protein